jgi:hypothetical protein
MDPAHAGEMLNPTTLSRSARPNRILKSKLQINSQPRHASCALLWAVAWARARAVGQFLVSFLATCQR